MLSRNFKLTADLMKTPGHEHIEKSIPERLFLFLSLLFEGMGILEGLMENLLKL